MMAVVHPLAPPDRKADAECYGSMDAGTRVAGLPAAGPIDAAAVVCNWPI